MTAKGSVSIDSAFVIEFLRDCFGANPERHTPPSVECVGGPLDSRVLHNFGRPFAAIRRSTAADSDRVFEIWRDAVDATHHFLTPFDRREIAADVAAFLPQVPLWLAVDGNDSAMGFMLLDRDRMEALFVDPRFRGIGIGRALVLYALNLSPAISTDVNEQNLQAVGFYRHLGFERIGYSPRDEQGRPYPLIHLRKSRVSDSSI